MSHAIPELPSSRATPAQPAAAQRDPEELQQRLDGLAVNELLTLRAMIDGALPARSLKDMDLAHELVLQTLALQQLQLVTLQDDGTKANQKAQVANSLSASLVTLVKMQGDVYTSERFKRLEGVLIDYLNAMPDSAARAEAFERYERELAEAGL